MKKIIIKKSNKFKVYYLKVKNALYNNKKLIVINNYNVLNSKSKELNRMLQTRLINNNVVRGLKLKFPISGLSKIIKFKSLSELNTTLITLSENKSFFDVVLVKIYNKIYNLTKISDLFFKSGFISNKKKFLLRNLTTYVTNLNFLQQNFVSTLINFFTILHRK